MAVSIVDQLEVIQIQHHYSDFVSLIRVIVASERKTVSDLGKRINICHIIQILDIDIQIHDELFEGSREDTDLILLVIIQFCIVVPFADLFRSFRQLQKRICDPPCERHDYDDKDNQQYGKDNRDLCVH